MQPHGAKWKPNPQPLRTKVMTVAVGCGTDENGEACAVIENDDANTPQVRINDNLLSMTKPFWNIAFEKGRQPKPTPCYAKLFP
jgi:hypothetical protein